MMQRQDGGGDESNPSYSHNQEFEPEDLARKIYKLTMRQQPKQARLCSFKDKVDRRPIDPPPIVQLQMLDAKDEDYLQNPNFFMFASIVTPDKYEELDFVNGNRTTAGTVVQSLYRLKDVDNTDGGFFIFPDMSVRVEGKYRIKFSLFVILGPEVVQVQTEYSDIFIVYSPKLFPGMSESTFLTRSFSDQGVRIRIRKENRANQPIGGRRKRSEEADDDGSDEDSNSQSSPKRAHTPNSGDSLSPSPSNLSSFASNTRPTISSSPSQSSTGQSAVPGRFNISYHATENTTPYEEYAINNAQPLSLLGQQSQSFRNLQSSHPLDHMPVLSEPSATMTENAFTMAPSFPPLPSTSLSPRPAYNLPIPHFSSPSPRNPEERKPVDPFSTLFRDYAKQHGIGISQASMPMTGLERTSTTEAVGYQVNGVGSGQWNGYSDELSPSLLPSPASLVGYTPLELAPFGDRPAMTTSTTLGSSAQGHMNIGFRPPRSRGSPQQGPREARRRSLAGRGVAESAQGHTVTKLSLNAAPYEARSLGRTASTVAMFGTRTAGGYSRHQHVFLDPRGFYSPQLPSPDLFGPRESQSTSFLASSGYFGHSPAPSYSAWARQ